MKTPPEASLETERASKSTAPNKRRSERRILNAVIRVYGSTDGGKSFYEEARTINVSTHGALLEINTPARVGQKLMLINEAAERQQICKVVNVRNLDAEAAVVAVEFPVPHAEFWDFFFSVREGRPSKKRAESRGNEADSAVYI
jgi:hypothetical protein